MHSPAGLSHKWQYVPEESAPWAVTGDLDVL